MAVLIYLTYSNLLNVAQSWIEQGKVSFWVGLLFLHIVVALISIGMFWLRVRNQPLLPSGLWRRAAKKTGGA